MSNTYLQHPAESALERFLLHNNDEVELDTVESHILTCESCLTRLEILEFQIAVTKIALQNIRWQEAAKKEAPSRSWFTLPRMAGAFAALALGIGIAPQFPTHHTSIVQVRLVAYRGGLGASNVPRNRDLRVHLDASYLNESNVTVQLVNERGAQLWKTAAAVSEGRIEINIPRIGETGTHFVRIYALPANREGDLLREFAFNVK